MVMEKQKPLFRIVLTEQAKEFIDSLPLSAREKMDYIIYREQRNLQKIR